MNRAERRRLLKRGVSRQEIKKREIIERVTAQAARDTTVEATAQTVLQFVSDCSKLALNREFGFGPGRLAKFHWALDAEMNRWKGVIEHPDDGDLSTETGYLRTKFDEELRRVLGENYVHGFEARYKWVDNEVI